MADCVKNFPTQRVTVDNSNLLKSSGHVINIPMATMGSEYSWTQAGVKKFILKPKKGSVEFGYIAGGPYFSEIPCGGSYETDSIDPSSTTSIFFKSDETADIMSIEYWT